jgi:hypothetical protein
MTGSVGNGSLARRRCHRITLDARLDDDVCRALKRPDGADAVVFRGSTRFQDCLAKGVVSNSRRKPYKN